MKNNKSHYLLIGLILGVSIGLMLSTILKRPFFMPIIATSGVLLGAIPTFINKLKNK